MSLPTRFHIGRRLGSRILGVTTRILVKSFEEESSQIQADDMLKLSYLASQLNSGCLAQLNIYDDVKCNIFVRLNMGCAFDYPHEPRELQTRDAANPESGRSRDSGY